MSDKTIDLLALMSSEEREAALLFNEGIERGEKPALTKTQKQRLVQRGLIHHVGRGKYEQTKDMLVIANLLSVNRNIEKTNTIYEHELKQNVERGAVSMMTVKEVLDGKYSISVFLSWRPGEVVLVTQKKHPRLWSSLDTLKRHIQKHYHGGEIPIINLQLKRSK